jgi:hypothetical protein
MRDKILLCERVLVHSFNLWDSQRDSAYHFVTDPVPEKGQGPAAVKPLSEEIAEVQEQALVQWLSARKVSPSFALANPEAFAAIVIEAADSGDADAKFVLSLIYDQGRGVPPDPVASRASLHAAAEAGCAIAQCILGYTYQYGVGTNPDQSIARKWLAEAASRHLPLATRIMADTTAMGRTQHVTEDPTRKGVSH